MKGSGNQVSVNAPKSYIRDSLGKKPLYPADLKSKAGTRPLRMPNAPGAPPNLELPLWRFSHNSHLPPSQPISSVRSSREETDRPSTSTTSSSRPGTVPRARPARKQSPTFRESVPHSLREKTERFEKVTESVWTFAEKAMPSLVFPLRPIDTPRMAAPEPLDRPKSSSRSERSILQKDSCERTYEQDENAELLDLLPSSRPSSKSARFADSDRPCDSTEAPSKLLPPPLLLPLTFTESQPSPTAVMRINEPFVEFILNMRAASNGTPRRGVSVPIQPLSSVIPTTVIPPNPPSPPLQPASPSLLSPQPLVKQPLSTEIPLQPPPPDAQLREKPAHHQSRPSHLPSLTQSVPPPPADNGVSPTNTSLSSRSGLQSHRSSSLPTTGNRSKHPFHRQVVERDRRPSVLHLELEGFHSNIRQPPSRTITSAQARPFAEPFQATSDGPTTHHPLPRKPSSAPPASKTHSRRHPSNDGANQGQSHVFSVVFPHSGSPDSPRGRSESQNSVIVGWGRSDSRPDSRVSTHRSFLAYEIDDDRKPKRVSFERT